jgi:hypothetical protein
MAIQIDGDTGVSGVNGSATTPALQGTDSNTGIVFGTDEVQIATGGSTRATVDSSGRLLVGTTTARTDFYSGALDADVQLEDSSYCAYSAYVTNGNAAFIFGRGNPASGSVVGNLSWMADDGTDEVEAARISAQIDGTPGSNDMPGRLVFSTTADGASSTTERMRLDSSGRLAVGITNPSCVTGGIHAVHSNTEGSPSFVGNEVGIFQRNFNSAQGSAIGIISGSASNSDINLGDKDSANIGKIRYNNSSNFMSFTANSSERMRLTNDGEVLIGTTSQFSASSSSATGHRIEPEGTVSHYRNSGTVMYVGRQGNDGVLINFRQAGSQEGTISVSGTTVTYGGGHLARWSQLAGGAERTEILRGSVLSNLDEMCEWAYDAQDAVLYTEEDELPEGVSVGDVKTPARDAGTEDNEQLNRMKVSDVEGDANVSGVFVRWDDDDDTYTNDFYCAMTGDFVIRIAQGTTVARGDLLMSAGDGTAKPQDDDIVRSKTIAKVTSTTVSTTYTDGSYCVPCVLMAC